MKTYTFWGTGFCAQKFYAILIFAVPLFSMEPKISKGHNIEVILDFAIAYCEE